MNTCAVIPAAGRGIRLGLDRPKILAPLNDNETIWSVLRRKLVAIVDHIHVIVSPEGEAVFRDIVAADLDSGLVSVSIQPSPIGMGDAVFRGYSTWSRAKTIIVVWGDQVFVSEHTISAALSLHACHPNTVVLPLVKLKKPYVEYVFDRTGKLVKVLQMREGDLCNPGGSGDVGTFVLSTDGLYFMWKQFLAMGVRGAATGEANFLPFFPFLASKGWDIHPLQVSDGNEARGVNSPDDLIFFRTLFAKGINNKCKVEGL
jgi:bifunctional UDP-N-acetylglucosamine pyrophosphorylase/glucosamine-1-phosphate N-acetyltransferase